MCADTTASGRARWDHAGMTEISVSAPGARLTVHLWGPADGVPVLLIHGNCSSGLFWEPLVRRLPSQWRIAAPDLRGYGGSDAAPVDATRGLGEFVDDVLAVIDTVFGADVAPVVAGHSMGGGIALRLAAEHPTRVAGLLLEAPLSPYGFGGSRDLDGTPTTDDFAGTGGGGVNPEFIKRLAAKDRGDEPTSPRTVMRTTYVADPEAFGADEDAMLATMLSTVVSEDNYPGDSATSPHWPMIAPGVKGVLNAMSPRYFNVASELVALTPKPPVVWVRGDRDAIVSDASLFDLANLGKLGAVPGWPGEEACPPQPMVGQTRAVLERYAAAGGRFTEVVLTDCGHSPHIEYPEPFAAQLRGLVTPE